MSEKIDSLAELYEHEDYELVLVLLKKLIYNKEENEKRDK